MNNFHVYEAIVRGKYSTVYKGSKKKTIEYFAIKSVDKSQKNRVLHEVRMLHALDHPNVLKFYAWYETSAHLWLVSEYCVGGDLMTLLKQDRQLPEDSIHDLPFDLVRALQFLHSKGIIYGDLKPSNILLDENGHPKLCDFGLARKLSDISKTVSSMLPQAKRGTPCYMSPELFEDGVVHSYASDFWALGCVLYECYAGRPPFVGREFTHLVKSIMSDPTPAFPGTPSRPFANLVSSLLVKDPYERIKWSELCGHAFWRTKLIPLPLPLQPAFDSVIELQAKLCLTERNGARSSQSKTPSKHHERDTKGAQKQDEIVLGSKGNDRSTKSTPSSRKNHPKVAGRLVEEKPKELSSASKRINLLRLSRIAKSNLQRENEKENYRMPLPNGSEIDLEVKIENNDMELDFNENAEDEAHEELEGSNHPNGRSEEVESNMHQLENSPAPNMGISDESSTNVQESPLEHVDMAATPLTASPHLKTTRGKGVGSAIELESSKSSSDLSHVLWHVSDLSVRPVMPSRKADKVSEVIPSLPFEALQPSDFIKMSKEQLDTLSSRIISIFNSNTSIGEKQNVIRYLEMLSSNAEAANILTNGPIMPVLVKMFRLSKVSALSVQLASLIGLLIRHATCIEDDLGNSGILGSLSAGLDKQEKVRRFSMAALGELLFYISTQNEQGKANNPPESPSKNSRCTSGWQVPNSLILLVSSVLRKGEDDITQLYALGTIENVCSQGGHWAARFASQDVISNLCYIYRAAGKPESMRLTAGSCLVRVARFNPPSIQSVVEKLSFKDLASALVKGAPREQQIRLNLLNMALLGSHVFANMGRHLSPLGEEKNLVPNLVSLIEQGSEILRGKALLLMALLCKHGRRWLPLLFCNARLLLAVDRLSKEKETYLRQCVDAFIHIVASIVPNLLDVITGDIQQLLGGRRRGQVSAIANRVTPKTSIHLFPVVLHLLGSALLKCRMVNHQVLQQLANLIKIVGTPFQGRDDFQITLLQVLESIAEESAVILESPGILVGEILPSLTVLYKGNKDGDARFLCLKILFDVMAILLNKPSEDEQRSEALKSISNTHFLPLYATFIKDEDPIPMYAQKLLVMLIEFDYIKILDILHPETVSQCFEFLLGDLSSANVNNVKLCLALSSAPEMESKLLSQLKVVRKIGNLLEFVYAKDMEDFLEPTLGLCRAFLLHSVGGKRGLGYKNEPALLNDGSSDASCAMDQEQCIRDIMDFGSNIGVLLELTGYGDTNVADMASECVVLLLKAAPREAITGFLANLPKVSIILESWRKGIFHLFLQRTLHALSYSCSQYRSHALILSISVPEISRIEAVVSELKKSNVPNLANAAQLVASVAEATSLHLKSKRLCVRCYTPPPLTHNCYIALIFTGTVCERHAFLKPIGGSASSMGESFQRIVES